ncbi:MAG: peptide chain release factor N(5)-glutamine methyltransferase, partial [Rhodanobacteraceae bacterium]
MRVRDLLSRAMRALSDEGRSAPSFPARSDAELLLAHALGVSRAWLVAHDDDE